jgi:hypothetical protein
MVRFNLSSECLTFLVCLWVPMQLWSKRLPPWSIALEIKQIWDYIAKFLVKRLLRYLDVAKVAWYHMEHTCEDGTSSHGALDLDRISRMSFQAPCISKHLKECVEERLDRSLIIKQIYEEHKKVSVNAHILTSRNWPKGSKWHQRSHKCYFTLVLHVFFSPKEFFHTNEILNDFFAICYEKWLELLQ